MGVPIQSVVAKKALRPPFKASSCCDLVSEAVQVDRLENHSEFVCSAHCEGVHQGYGVNTKTVPRPSLPCVPPPAVVPQSVPFATVKPASGYAPSGGPVKPWSTLSVPAVVTLKTVPKGGAPFDDLDVVP
jgi:hypothetical protein